MLSCWERKVNEEENSGSSRKFHLCAEFRCNLSFCHTERREKIPFWLICSTFHFILGRNRFWDENSLCPQISHTTFFHHRHHRTHAGSLLCRVSSVKWMTNKHRTEEQNNSFHCAWVVGWFCYLLAFSTALYWCCLLWHLKWIPTEAEAQTEGTNISTRKQKPTQYEPDERRKKKQKI